MSAYSWDFLISVAVLLAFIIEPSSPLNLLPQSTTRRRFLSKPTLIALPFIHGSGVLADTTPSSLYKAWSAGDGFLDESFISFSLDSYKSMIEDKSRTPAFKQAITEVSWGWEWEDQSRSHDIQGKAANTTGPMTRFAHRFASA